MIYPAPPERDPAEGRRANGATPVADPGLCPAGTDAEAAGHAGEALPRPDHPRPDTSDIEAGGLGLRLTPTVWYVLGALGAALLLTSLLLSF
jgi:hypothetical protein